jgi:hypothetical protein
MKDYEINVKNCEFDVRYPEKYSAVEFNQYPTNGPKIKIERYMSAVEAERLGRWFLKLSKQLKKEEAE